MTLSFPAHPMFDYSRRIDVINEERYADLGRHPWIALVVSQNWKDTDWIEDFVDKVAAKYDRATIVTAASAMGAAKLAGARTTTHGLRLIEVESRKEFGSHRQGVQAGQIVRLSDIVMVCWAGGTDLPKNVIDHALKVHRPEHRFRPGLHVYEQTKTRATKSRKAQLTGKVRYRVLGERADLVERKAA